jgi:hypothetical protein
MASRGSSSSSKPESSKSPSRAQEVRAYVGLRSPSGMTVQEAAPSMLSAENIRQMIATPETRERARDWLESQGFHVEHVSPLNIRITGPRQRFEDVFQGRLERLPAPDTRATKSSARKKAAAGSGDELVHWDWAKGPTIPSDAKELIGSLALPQPTKTLE